MPWDEETEEQQALNDPYTCPVCKRDDCVPAGGKYNSSILLIGEFPGEDELGTGRPFTGKTGRVLRKELGRVGIDLSQCRLANLWLHPPAKGKVNSNKECFEYGLMQLLKETKDKKAILLIGSETVKFFCDKSVSLVNGLQVKSSYFPVPLIMACVQPATAFHGGIGEIRLTIHKFAKALENIEYE